MKQIIISCLLLALALCRASVIPASSGVGIAVPVAAAHAALLPVSGSHQFVARNYNGYYVPATTTAAWPAWSAYPTTYHKYGGGYPSYAYPYNYPYNYYPYGYGYGYGYGYKSVW